MYSGVLGSADEVIICQYQCTVIPTSNNKKGWFIGKSGQARQLLVHKLLRDVPTRWDSVYYMISHLHKLWPAVDIFLSSPIYPELAKYKMTAQEWRVLRDIEMILLTGKDRTRPD
ncbi:hypothetical protein BD779DRAFT_1732569 [Infundibulicybe gibba]|nr:hypothetical protein BD779DRAFT_1732569 [Infundibulicybe gibba]